MCQAADIWQALVIGFIFVAPAWNYRVWHPVVETGHYFWIYSLLRTPAMVLLTVPQVGSETLDADVQRGLLTLLAAVVVALVRVLVRVGVGHFLASDAETRLATSESK